MERQEALERLQAAFPDAEADVSLDRDDVWFTIKTGKYRHGLAFKSYDKVDQAIAVLSQNST